MRTEQDKWITESEIFCKFVALSGQPVDLETIQKPIEHSLPDVFCSLTSGDQIAFELVEICDANLAEIANIIKPDEIKVIVTTDPTFSIINKKISKEYRTSREVHLLCYVDGRVVSPDDQIVATARKLLGNKRGIFKRIWFLGEKGLYNLTPN